MTERLENVSNYIVPAAGTTRGYVVNRKFVAGTPVTVDFRGVGLDGQPYRPSGVFVDNTRGTAPLTVIINEINFSFQIPAGSFAATPYPAPMQQSATLLGEGDVTLVFVDFPVIPMGVGASSGGGSGGGDWTPEDISNLLADIAAIKEKGFTAFQASLMLTDLQDIKFTQQGMSSMLPSFLGDMSGDLGSIRSYVNSINMMIGPNHGDVMGMLGNVLTSLNNNHAALMAFLQGVDSDGAALPQNFAWLPRSFTYDANGAVETETRTDGTQSWVKTYANNAAGDPISESAWVKQP